MSPEISYDLIAQRPFALFSAWSRPDLESPLNSLALSGVMHWLIVRVAPSVVIVNSHWPLAMRSAALRPGMQQHNPANNASDDKHSCREMQIMSQHTLNQTGVCNRLYTVHKSLH